MTRAERIEMARQRALEYADAGDLAQAHASLVADLTKSEDTAEVAVEIGTAGMARMIDGDLSTPAEMRRWIEGATARILHRPDCN